ncbi:arsenite methyltransferase [Halorhabdus amylolytica]|uniref:arsenite methyltransferase n=1 Tax=Halorhabdus amylolytica TaxID=2559573 RepID=UPI0010AA3BA9|nr:arsenite methyltransferase [Halorhabdus amylolytica]
MSEKASTDDTDELSPSEQRRAVRERYGDVAEEESRGDRTAGGGCCGGGTDAETRDAGDGATDSSCCGASGTTDAAERARDIGYSDDQLETVPDASNMGLSCGNPTAIASLEAGETVLDLGSGGGFDCFLASDAVGPNGRVIGVDMTPEMVEKARENARDRGDDTVDFRLGEIEHLPVADEAVDVIISNCVLNLSPDKSQVFREAARVLRPGGRLAISDVVRTAELPEDLRIDPESVSACIGDAAPPTELEAMLGEAGFIDVSIEPTDDDEFISEWHPERDPREYVASARIEARKPDGVGDADG